MAMKKKNRHGFLKFLLFWICLFAVATGVGLRYLWGYLADYEASTSENFIADYETSLTEDRVIAMSQEFLDTLDPVLTDRDAAGKLVAETVGTSLKCAWKSGSSEEEAYALLSGDSAVGELTIARTGEEDSYGFRAWAVEKESVSLPELIESSTLTLPADYSVKVNGNEIGSEYITETGIHYDFLEEYYVQYASLPTKVTYSFSNYVGPLNTVIYDRDGNETSIDPNADDTQFVAALSDEENTALNSFAGDFLRKYFQYTSGVGNLETSYNNLSKYLIEGSDLVERLKAAEDGLYWAHTTSVNLESYTLNSVVKVDGSTLLVDLTAKETATREAANASETYNIGMKLVLTGNAQDGYKVATLELY